jgi:hypothetical protein
MESRREMHSGKVQFVTDRKYMVDNSYVHIVYSTIQWYGRSGAFWWLRGLSKGSIQDSHSVAHHGNQVVNPEGRNVGADESLPRREWR